MNLQVSTLPRKVTTRLPGRTPSLKSLQVTVGELIILASFIRPVEATATTIYVDSGISSNCVGTYNPGTRACGGGSDIGYRTVTTGVATAQSGDTVMIPGEATSRILAPPRSGSPDKHIIIKNYPGETPTLSNVDSPAIFC